MKSSLCWCCLGISRISLGTNLANVDDDQDTPGHTIVQYVQETQLRALGRPNSAGLGYLQAGKTQNQPKRAGKERVKKTGRREGLEVGYLCAWESTLLLAISIHSLPG